MKKLITTLFALFLFTSVYSQEYFSGNWAPTKDQKWFNNKFETKANYIKNFNIFNDDIFIVSYLTERDYIEYQYKNPLTVFDKSQFKERKDFHEAVLDYDEKNIKTIFYNSKNNYRVYINYYLKSKTKIVATYVDFDTNKIKGIVAYQRKK